MLQHVNTSGRSRFTQGGFTFIETMIVVAIIGVLAALAVPNLRMMLARHDLYQATTSLYNRLIFTRSGAISRNAMMAALLPVTTPMGATQIPFTAPLSSEILPVSVGVLLFPAQPVAFTPRGLSTTPLATQTIQLQSVRFPTMVYTISVSPQGKVTWCNTQVNPCVVNLN